MVQHAHAEQAKKDNSKNTALLMPMEILKGVEVSPLERIIPIIPSSKSQMIWMNFLEQEFCKDDPEYLSVDHIESLG